MYTNMDLITSCTNAHCTTCEIRDNTVGMFTLDFDLSASRQSCVASVGGGLDSERGLPCLTVKGPQSWWAVVSSWLMARLSVPPSIYSSGKLACDRWALSSPPSTSKLLQLLVCRHSADLDFNISFKAEQLPHFRMRWFWIFLAAAGEIWYTESAKVLGLYSPSKECGNWFCQKRKGGRILKVTCYQSHVRITVHTFIHTQDSALVFPQRHTIHYNEYIPNHADIFGIALQTYIACMGRRLAFMCNQ